MRRSGSIWLSVMSALMIGVCCYSLYLSAKVRTYENPETDTTRLVIVDTISYYKPISVDSRILSVERYVFPVFTPKDNTPVYEYATAGLSDSADSVMVDLPIVQRHYRDSVYEAWVSGPVDPRLDSVYVFPRQEYVTVRDVNPRSRPKRWHVGVSAGYAVTAHGMDPYLGFGVTYSFCSF